MDLSGSLFPVEAVFSFETVSSLETTPSVDSVSVLGVLPSLEKVPLRNNMKTAVLKPVPEGTLMLVVISWRFLGSAV